MRQLRTRVQILRAVQVLLVALGATACLNSDVSAPASEPVAVKKVEAAPSAPLRVPTFVEYTTGGAAEGDELPMIVALHGLGDTPEHFFSLVKGYEGKARVIVPRGYDAYGRGYSWFALTRSADGRVADAEGISTAADGIAALVRRVSKERPTRGKPVLVGFSQGGILGYALSRRDPELFALVLPIAGTLPSAMAAAPERSARLIGFHGEDDARIPAKPTREMIDAWKGAGLPVELKTYPGVGHHTNKAMLTELFSAIGEAHSSR